MATERAPRRSLRLWPGVAAALLLLLARLALPPLVPDAASYGLIGGALAALLILLWWLFLSRAPWVERLGAIALMLVVTAGTWRLLHPSIAGAMMGMMFPIFVVQTMAVALVAWALATRRLADAPRRAWMIAAIVVGCGVWTLARTEGVTGNSQSQLRWRWTRTAEEHLLARDQAVPDPSRIAATGETPVVTPAVQPPTDTAAAASATLPTARPAPTAPSAAGSAEASWPGFRGPARDDVVRGVRIQTDWSMSVPVEMWRRPVGPGWSSFAVRGNRLYTQEQRGDHELVSCYALSTGEPLWQHRDAVRFYESNGGAGPRATPTLSEGRVYALGATGILNALDARSGSVLWSRDVASDTGTKVPTWGFSGSPLVVNDLVIVAVAGTLAAYEATTGTRRWMGPRAESYSSPHLVTVGGEPHVLQMTDRGVTSVSPADGALLWKHAWDAGATIVQPAVISDGQILISMTGPAGGIGLRRLAIAREAGGWTATEVWTTNGLKPYFNDFVVHEGHAYGFDGSILACVDLKDGRRTWKGGRYGNGQLVLLADQGVLLVVSEEGELALVKATPAQFTELGRRPALEGKTWNHPVVVGDVLLVRNGQEMAAFRLAQEPSR